jgi:signal transduction histidine kinase
MDKLQFKVSSALKDLVGKDLIRNENIAIFELVKNSYDAFATKVEITFEPERIIIADNGKGMTLDDLKNKWLFLAYSAKKDGSEDSEPDEKQQSYRDQINRHYAGAKGVGRFSCDRLGANLIVTTKSEKDKHAEQLTIDWTAFEKDQKKEFIEVDVQHETLSELPNFPENKKTGTILEITDLRNIWARDEILRLKQSLEKLINPFSESLDFTIEIICEWAKKDDENEKRKDNYYDRNIVNGVVKNSISQVIGLKTTKIDVTLNSNFIETSVVDRDVEIYKIREKNTFDKLSSVTINLYFLNKAAKTAFSMKMGVQPVNYGSIFLFRNGFRILPFGNPGDDSWKLDYRAQQGYNRFLGTRDLFGRVDIQTDNVDEFKEVSSRDGGLIQSETTLQLMRLFETTHHRLERYVTGVLWGEGFLKRQYFKDITDVDKNRELLGKDKELDSADYVIKSSLGSKIDFVQLVKTLISDKNIEVLSYNKQLANIFSEPTLFDDANPQVITDLERIAEKTKDADLMSSIDEAKQKIAELQKQKEKAERDAEEANIRADRAEEETQKALYEASVAKVKQEKAEKENVELDEQIKQVQKENMFLVSDVNSDVKQLASLQHTITHTSKKIRIELDDAMNYLKSDDKGGVVNCLNKIFILNQQVETLSGLVSKVNYNVKANKITKDFVDFTNEYLTNFCITNYSNIKFHVPKTEIVWETKFEAIKIIIIIDNLLSNSDKFQTKNIYIDWKENSETIDLIYKDDGDGIAPDILPKVFNYRFSTTDGGGLGLYHIKSIMESDFNGSVELKSEKGKGAEFILHFPKGEQR